MAHARVTRHLGERKAAIMLLQALTCSKPGHLSEEGLSGGSDCCSCGRYDAILSHDVRCDSWGTPHSPTKWSQQRRPGPPKYA
jgi:hypothetical protein